MKREELEHILRAAAKIAGDPEVLVLGSQSILGTYDADELPDAAHASIEADVTFFEDYDNEKSDVVDMYIGEDSRFHLEFGYYAQGVNVEVAVLPAGWRDRVVELESDATEGATGHCLDPHDLAVAKLVAHREKDMEFVDALLHAELIDPDLVIERAQLLERQLDAGRVIGWITGWVMKHRH